MQTRLTFVFAAALCFACQSEPATPALVADADGFSPLFNGTDLSGWVNVNCAPGTWTWRDGMVVCSGKPTGVMRTERMYQDFELEIDWRHMHAGGNAGIFVMSDALTAKGEPFTRSTEVQVLDGTETANYTSHGDVFSIHGARLTPDRPHPGGWERCLPSERRAKPSPEWNHYKIICKDGTLKLEVNGAEVSGAKDLTPRRGYICLESEGSEVHFKNVRLKELPKSKSLDAKLVATQDEGFVSLYNGMDFKNWRAPVGADAAHWTVRDWTLVCESPATPLWSEQEFGDCEVIADVRAVEGHPSFVLHARGPKAFEIALEPKPKEEWSRIRVHIVGEKIDINIDGELSNGEMPKVRARGPIGLSGEGGGRLEFANVYVRELR